MTPEFGIGRRMRAARHLAGIDNVDALAARIAARGVRGLGQTVLRQIEREERSTDFADTGPPGASGTMA